MKKIGLFGGSFDPVHIGHLLVARAAKEELQLDKLFVIPAAQSPFKPQTTPAPATLRAAMLRMAFSGCPWVEVDAQEIERGGTSYTIDTVRDYRARFPEADLCYLVGADHVPLLPNWRDSRELAALATFAVIPRPGQADVEFPPPFRGRRLTGFPFGLSASQIRCRVRHGQDIAQFVPAAVAWAIHQNGLYL